MTENPARYSPQFQAEVKGVVVGGGNTIYNYFYTSATQIASARFTETDTGETLPCPYQGLFHFGPDDAPYFFGREDFVKKLVEATQSRNFIPLFGASGSGKSSVVFAGLVPTLEQAGNWKFTYFRPGADPFYSLALALVPLYNPKLDRTDIIRQAKKLAGAFRDEDEDLTLSDVLLQIQQYHPTQQVLLIADQFEELYTLCTESETRRHFLDCLLENFSDSKTELQSVTNVVLILTMRIDFLGNALSYRPLADLLNDDLKLGAMNADELSRVVTEPAKKLGVTFEEGLVERILGDVESEPGDLPLLEFALTELWCKRSGKIITHDAYEEIGEVQGALTRYADKCLFSKELKPIRERVRQIFVQLVQPGEGIDDTRRIATKAELGEENWTKVVAELANQHLVVTSQNAEGEETVEVVHEALIRRWGELRGWMEIDRNFRMWQENLRSSLRQWEEMERSEDILLRGVMLALAEHWLEKRREDIGLKEREFIEASAALRNREEQEKQRQQRFKISVLAATCLLFFGLSGWALWQWRQAELSRSDALTRSAESLLARNRPFEALLESLRAGVARRQLRAKPNLQLTSALHQAASQLREYNRLESHADGVTGASLSGDGQILASAGRDGTIKLWNFKTGQLMISFDAHDKFINSIAFSQDGKLASVSDDGTIKLWDIQGEKVALLKIMDTDEETPIALSWSADGQKLAATGYDNNSKVIVEIWDIKNEVEYPKISGYDLPFFGIQWSGDGQKLAFAGQDGKIYIWDEQKRQEIRTLIGHEYTVQSLDWSQDNNTLVSGGYDGIIRLWDVDSNKEIYSFFDPNRKNTTQADYENNSVNSIRFIEGDRIIAAGRGDGTIQFFDVDSKTELSSLISHDLSVNHLMWNEENRVLASASDDGTIRFWKIEPEQPSHTLSDHNSWVYTMDWSEDDRVFVSGDRDGIIRVWDVENGKVTQTINGNGDSVSQFTLIEKVQKLASISNNKIKLWSMESGENFQTLSGHKNEVYSMSWSESRQILASGDRDGIVILWDVDKGAIVRQFNAHENWVTELSFSPDGKILASHNENYSQIKLWDVETGEEIITLPGHRYISDLKWSRDGKILVSAGGMDKTIRLWDVETGQQIRTLLSHKAGVTSLSLSEDGRILASASDDDTIKLWNLETGAVILTLSNHTGVRRVSWSNDGQTLASAGVDGTIKLWNFDFEELLKIGCTRLYDYLQYNPNVSDEDRKLCDGIATSKQSAE